MLPPPPPSPAYGLYTCENVDIFGWPLKQNAEREQYLDVRICHKNNAEHICIFRISFHDLKIEGRGSI